MNTFFDLKEFLITLLKKVRLSLIIIFVCTLLGGLIRFIPLMKEYLTYDDRITEATSLDDTDDYPYLYEARRTLYIKPDYQAYGSSVINASAKVIEAYYECYQNEEILQPLVDEFFEKASVLYYKNIEGQIKYQYINQAAVRNFTMQDFYSWFMIGTNSHFINLRVKSPSIEFSEEAVDKFENLLSNYVKELVGEYEYIVTTGQIGTSLPADTTGVVLQPNGNAVKEKNTISYIVLRSIKGGIWGFGAGVALSLILCFFFYSVSPQIYEEEDLKEYHIPVLASIFDKSSKKKVPLNDRLIAFLRGNTAQFCDYMQCGQVINATLLSEKSNVNKQIAVTGSCSVELVQKVNEALAAAELGDTNYTQVDNIVYSAQALEEIRDIDKIILVEKLNESSKVEIQRELDKATYLNKKVLGFIVIR